jgi:acyl dehydratase
MWQDQVGSRSNVEVNLVEKGAVRKFAEAIGDLNPLYIDEAVAEKSRYGRLMAPPTFPRTFSYGVIEGLKLPKAGLIHGEQRFYYERPLWVGDEVACYTVLKDFYEKKGSRGVMSFLVFERVGEDANGERVFMTEEILIVTEAVRKGMEE